jgi:hypothetical protein
MHVRIYVQYMYTDSCDTCVYRDVYATPMFVRSNTTYLIYADTLEKN